MIISVKMFYKCTCEFVKIVQICHLVVFLVISYCSSAYTSQLVGLDSGLSEFSPFTGYRLCECNPFTGYWLCGCSRFTGY